ncbi:MAG: DUF6356 family protein [Planctomycetota bacterium]|nr:DUF6356 family protein [Planctomycetota bacterium]
MPVIADLLNLIPSKHTQEVGETYVEHFKYAMGTSKELLKASAWQAFHAVFPDAEIPDRHSLVGVAQWTLMESFKRGDVVPKGD